MTTMPLPAQLSEHLALYRAIAISLAIHAAALALKPVDPGNKPAEPQPLQARLAPRVFPPPETPPASTGPARASQPKPRKIISIDRTAKSERQTTPTWTAAQRNEMDNFLNGLADEAKRRPPPTMAQRSLAMAREAGRSMAQADEASEALLELRPNAPAPSPFSLEFYMDALVRRLNHSAGFVKNEQRHAGLHTAAVQFRLNPDGTLKSFIVLNAADQADEIAFIKAVIERAVPFSPFPPEIDRAARSLGVTVCIQPGRDNETGFSRMQGGRCR